MSSHYQLHIPSIHCNACLRTVTRAIIEVDQSATISASDVEQRTIDISTSLTPTKISETLADVGHELKTCVLKQTA